MLQDVTNASPASARSNRNASRHAAWVAVIPMSRWPIVTLHFFMSSNAMKNILTYLRSAESDAANFSTSWIVGSKGVPEPGTSLKPKSFSALR